MDRRAAAPYSRVKKYLLGEMQGGRWPPGAQMPSEAELVAQFGVSRMTVNRALRELQSEGLIERVQGVGTFAAPLQRHAVVAVHHQRVEHRRAFGQLQLRRQAGAGTFLALQVHLDIVAVAT